jgi:mannan endo-1,4-beta-mannosidase
VGFVEASGTGFILDGEPIRYSGANCYYLAFGSQQMADRALDTADALGLRLIRTLAFHEEQQNDEAFQQRLDYVVAGAARRGIRLLLPLTNNWKDFGGMPAYVARFGLDEHDAFYEDARARQAYKDWCSTLLTRVNPLTGIAYKDDPAIFGWELANEARCIERGIPILRRWIEEMSEHLQSIDSNHLVGLGDEGFFNRWTITRGKWWLNGSQGYDFDEFLRIPSVDFASFHLYPDALGVAAGYGNAWIEEHCESGDKAGKPVLLEEYGLKDANARNDVYGEWLATARKCRVASDLFWMLADRRDDGTLYPDYDGYTLYAETLPQSLRDHLLVA